MNEVQEKSDIQSEVQIEVQVMSKVIVYLETLLSNFDRSRDSVKVWALEV